MDRQSQSPKSGSEEMIFSNGDCLEVNTDHYNERACIQQNIDEIRVAVEVGEMDRKEAAAQIEALERQIKELDSLGDLDGSTDFQELSFEEKVVRAQGGIDDESFSEMVDLIHSKDAEVLENKNKESVDYGWLHPDNIRRHWQNEDSLKVKVKRSSGEVEDDWYATGSYVSDSDGALIAIAVKTLEDGTFIRKEIPLSKLVELNQSSDSSKDVESADLNKNQIIDTPIEGAGQETGGSDEPPEGPLRGGPGVSPDGPPDSPEDEVEKDPERAEYLRLKREFRAAQREYYDALETDYSERGAIQKMFGLGRDSLSPEVKVIYDKFMEANKAFHNFAQDSGMYQKVMERAASINKVDFVPEDANKFVAERHVLTPAERRLELQTIQMPERIRDLKDGIVSKIKKHPKAALAVGGLLAILNPAAVAAGATTGLLGKEFYIDAKQANQDQVRLTVLDQVGISDDFEKLEAEYFETVRQTHDAKVRTKMAVVGAAMAAGGAYESIGGESAVEEVVTDTEIDLDQIRVDIKNSDLVIDDVSNGDQELRFGDKSIQEKIQLNEIEFTPEEKVEFDEKLGLGSSEDVISRSEQVEVAADLGEVEALPETREGWYSVEKGDNLTTILFDSIKEKLSSGEIKLPEGVSREGLSHYIYQSFPEMTSASGVESRLDVEAWKELGVESGNPHLIRPGEQINVDALIEKMWGATPGSSGVEVSTDVVTDVSTTDSLSPNPPDELPQTQVEAEAIGMTSEVHLDNAWNQEIPENPLNVDGNMHAETDENWLKDGVPIDEGQEAVVKEDLADGMVEVSAVEGGLRQVQIVSADQILTERGALLKTLVTEHEGNGLSFVKQYDSLYGYQPLMTSEMEKLVVAGEPGVEIIEQVQEAIYSAYKEGQINLPAERTYYVERHPSALFSFVEENAKELTNNKMSAWFGGSDGLDLGSDKWRELGFKSGNPQVILPGDQIKMGELIKLIMENASERIGQSGSKVSQI